MFWKIPRLLESILRELTIIRLFIESELVDRPTRNFTPIKEISMVPLAAGQTAVFSTTAIPSAAQPIASGVVWSSSDSTNAPVSPNPADPSGLSTLVAFPTTVPAGVTFSLTVSYSNADGSVASQTNVFVTVAPPSPDITGFTDIVQTA